MFCTQFFGIFPNYHTILGLLRIVHNAAAVGGNIGVFPFIGEDNSLILSTNSDYPVRNVTGYTGLLIVLILQLFPRRVAGLFGSEDPLFYDFAVHYVRIYLLMNFCNALQPITSNFFTAIGKAQMGLWMTLVRQGVLLIPMLLLLPPLLGLDGVLWAGPISDGGAAVVVLLLGFREVRRLKALQTAQEKETPQ